MKKIGPSKDRKASYYPPYHYFICPGCDEDKELSPKEFASHVKDVHGISETTGKRSLMMHMSKEPRHAASYKWEIGGKTFYEYYG